MARRKQKFSILHVFGMVAALIWLPAIVQQLAGVQPEDSDPQKTEQLDAVSNLLDVKPASQSETKSPEDSPTTPRPFKVAPSSLTLEETLISSSGKTAIINHLAFSEQEMLTPLGYPFRVRSIEAGRVVLEGDGGLYELHQKQLWSR